MIESNSERQAPTRVSDVEPSHLSRYVFASKYLLPEHTVLDAPCGAGYGSNCMADEALCRVYGIDISPDAIGHAKEFFSSPAISFHVSDMQEIGKLFGGSPVFDYVISFEGIEHIEKAEEFLRGAGKLLLPEGKLIISTPRKPHGSPFHVREYSLEEYKELLGGHFRIDRMFGQVYTDIFDMAERKVNPNDYKKFNFIAECSRK